MTADYFQFQNERLWGRDLHHLPSASAWQQVLARREEDPATGCSTAGTRRWPPLPPSTTTQIRIRHSRQGSDTSL